MSKPSRNAIVGILLCFNSRADNSGNRYWAFRYVDCKTGKQVSATISGGESNINAIRYELAGEANNSIFYTTQELSIREFNNLTGALPYAGCAPFTLANYIRDHLSGKPSRYLVYSTNGLEGKEELIFQAARKLGGKKVKLDSQGVSFTANAVTTEKIQTAAQNLVRYCRVRAHKLVAAAKA